MSMSMTFNTTQDMLPPETDTETETGAQGQDGEEEREGEGEEEEEGGEAFVLRMVERVPHDDDADIDDEGEGDLEEEGDIETMDVEAYEDVGEGSGDDDGDDDVDFGRYEDDSSLLALELSHLRDSQVDQRCH